MPLIALPVTAKDMEGRVRPVLAQLSMLLLIAIVAANRASPAMAFQPPPDIPLTDPASLRLPTELYSPRSDLEAAIEQLRVAISNNRDPDERACLRLKLAWILEEHRRRIRMGWGSQGESSAEASEQIRTQSREARDRAIEATSQALQEATDSRVVAEAVYLLGLLHEWNGEYAAAITFYERILRQYPDVDLERSVSKSNRYPMLNSIAQCYAALGDRNRAVETYLRTIPCAESEKYREYAVLRLLEYEPRMPLGGFRLPDSGREILAKIADRSAFVVTLSARPSPIPSGEPVKVTYDLRGRLDCRIDWYRLVYRVWQLPAAERVPGKDATSQPAEAERSTGPIVAPGDSALKVWEAQWRPYHEVRSWIASPPHSHRTLWDPPFRTPRWPPETDGSEPRRQPPRDDQAAGRDKQGPAFEGASLKHQGEIVIHGVPPGRYLVSVPAIEFQRSIPPWSSLPITTGAAFVWSYPVEIEVSGSGQNQGT